MRTFVLRLVLTLFLESILASSTRKNIIVDTDLFSDVDDAGALMLAATLPNAHLLAVNVNQASKYSATAASAILAHYGCGDVPIGIKRPLTNETFVDVYTYELGEYASKVAFHYSAGVLPWGEEEAAWEPVELYRKVLAEAEDASITIVSIGFLDNLSALLNSTADSYSTLSGPELVARKVRELVIMGGGYPSGRSYNFWGSDPIFASHVINSWEGPVYFLGDDVGEDVLTGEKLMELGPENDPVRAAYNWYTYRTSRASWDPLTMLFAVNGLGELLKYGNDHGYNFVEADGSNHWIWDTNRTNQFFLCLKVSNGTAAAVIDELYLTAAKRASESFVLGDTLGAIGVKQIHIFKILLVMWTPTALFILGWTLYRLYRRRTDLK